MASRVRYVIGDIHGEHEKLSTLIDYLQKDAIEYIFLGDFIDKGKNSKETIDFLMNLSKVTKCIFLMGDHEYAWLQYLNGNERFLDFLLKYGGIMTLESYLSKKLTIAEARFILNNKVSLRKLLKIHIDFFLNLKFYCEANNEFICVHAGINPEDKNKPLKLHSKEGLVFIRDKFIYSRFLYQGKKIIFGHTAFKEPYADEYKIGIDTGAAYKEKGYGNLVAFNINKKEFLNHRGKIKRLEY